MLRRTRHLHDTQCIVYDGPDGDYRCREICFNSNATSSGAGGLHRLSIVDVTDKANPVALSRVGSANDGYSHQGWLTPDRRFFLPGDELNEVGREIGTTTRVWDVSDLDVATIATMSALLWYWQAMVSLLRHAR